MCKWLINIVAIATSCSLLAVPAASEDVRDPTKPLGYSGVGAINKVDSLELNSVLISTQRKLAIINGNTLREGQQIPGNAGITVQRILPQTVVLQQGEKTWALTLAPSIVKKH